jgi:hypothetical protein
MRKTRYVAFRVVAAFAMAHQQLDVSQNHSILYLVIQVSLLRFLRFALFFYNNLRRVKLSSLDKNYRYMHMSEQVSHPPPILGHGGTITARYVNGKC